MGKNKRGVALIWALVVSTTLLIISASLADSIIKDSRGSARIESSSQAYAAARSGIEKGKLLFADGKKNNYTQYKAGTLLSGVVKDYYLGDSAIANTPHAKVEFVYDASDKNYIIKSTGYVGDVVRYLEYKQIDVAPQTINWSTFNYNNPLPTLIKGSYTQKFSFWFSSLPHPDYFDIGLGQSPSNSNNSVWFRFTELDNTNCSDSAFTNKQSFTLNVKKSTAPTGTVTKSICLGDPKWGINSSDYSNPSPDLPSDKRFNVEISYINNLTVQMTLKSYDFNTTTPITTVSAPLDPSIFNNFSNTFTYFYHYISPQPEGTATRDSGMTKEFYANTNQRSIYISALQIGG